ncbi:hypothetical protein PR202_gb08519 [Eleusine coracana subsp. coracana]|uniref:Uncharacterized protein n=1 Tax=Eleusine coracana subsp. coracana TaxID=191504 RepID=A0AAV5EEU5_ELECO|nr:hypothetical protein PR202_gb08519 [Eleusine coracana subsp. coracana]
MLARPRATRSNGDRRTGGGRPRTAAAPEGAPPRSSRWLGSQGGGRRVQLRLRHPGSSPTQLAVASEEQWRSWT